MTRILVIEDEKPVRENLAEMLEAEGYSVVPAANGEEGVRLARQTQPDLILCDIRMPRLDGYGVLSVLSNDRLTETIPFIFLTARTEPADQRLGMNRGADDYIPKPFTRKDLLASVRKRLEKQQALIQQAEENFTHLHGGIANHLPDHLLSPISILLGNAEMLANAEEIYTNPAQVRGIARNMRRAASQLAQTVRSYMLTLELEAVQADPKSRGRLSQERLRLSGEQVASLLEGTARELGREEDLSVALEAGLLRISERVMFSLLEELTDQALRQSSPGNRVNVRGVKLAYTYQLTVATQVSTDPAALLLNSPGSVAIGLQLARRICEMYGGELRVEDSLDGFSQVWVTLPLA